jgi:glycosidase
MFVKPVRLVILRLGLVAALLISLLATALPVQAALNWVGNMWPAGGNTDTIIAGGNYTIYVQVKKDGVTPGGGQGSNITCTLHWAPVPYFGGVWGSVTDTPMSYNAVGPTGDNDEYMVTISPTVGLYEFTAFCTDTTDSTSSWQGAGNGKLVVDTTSGSCNSAAQSNNDVYGVGLGHNSFSTGYRTPFGAVKTNQGSVDLWFRTCMDDLNQLPTLRVYNDRTNALDYNYVMMDFDRHEADSVLGGVTFWKKTISIPTTPSILYYIFKAVDGTQSLYYRDDNPKFYGGEWGQSETVQQTAEDNSYQLTVYDQNFSTPTWMKNAVVYQIFPDRFRNGAPSNDPVNNTGWIYGSTVRARTWSEGVCDPRGAICLNEYGNQFFGGDLQGIIDELDTLQDMGITTLYLNPIFRSPSNHKYDTQDYLSIDPAFGSNALFQTLASQAEARGIKIILDGVFNHVSSDSAYFDRYSRFDASSALTSPSAPGTNDQSGACESTASTWRSWFTFSAGTGKCYDGTPGSLTLTYSDWAGYDSLPKLNSALAAVRDYLYNTVGSVARTWLSRGADGWRFDVGADVDGGSGAGNSNGFWSGYRTAARTQSSDALLLGEEWGDASSWLVGDQWDSVMNYRFQSALLNWMFDSCSGNGCSSNVFVDNDFNASSSSGTIQATSVDEFDLRLKSIQEDYPPMAWQVMMNLLDSHDTSRVLFMLKKISGDDANIAKDKLKFISLFMFTYPGAPTIYYGDEAGLAPDDAWSTTNSKWEDDPYNRAPFPWADQGLSPDTSMQAQFRKMAVLRGQYPVLRTGDLTDSTRHNTNQTYAYARTSGTDDLAVILLNRNPLTTQTVTMNNLNPAFNGTVLYDVMNCSGSPVTCPTYTVSGGSVTVNNIPALWGSVLVEGPLPAISVDLAVVTPNLAASGSTTVTATITDIGGQLAADGTTVNFTLLSGSGSLSSTTGTVSGGQASVTYNAPLSGNTVAVIRATAGTYASATDTASAFVGYTATASDLISRKLSIGPVTLDLDATMGATVLKTGLGEPLLSLAKFSTNPGTGLIGMKTDFIDANLLNAASGDEIEFRLNCTTPCTGTEILWWWDGASWNAWTAGQTGQTGGSNGYVWGKLNSSTTSPHFSDMVGTPLAGGSQSPTIIQVESLTVHNDSANLWGLIVLVGLALAGSAVWLAQRK